MVGNIDTMIAEENLACMLSCYRFVTTDTERLNRMQKLTRKETAKVSKRESIREVRGGQILAGEASLPIALQDQRYAFPWKG